MMKKILALPRLSREKGIVHGFSVRKSGDMSLRSQEGERNREKFLETLGLKKENLIGMEQVHKDKVLAVGVSEKGDVLKGADGLVTDEKGTVLGVRTADCLPILLCDPVKKIIGVTHAGWKGVLAKVGEKTINFMKKMGSDPRDILVGIGPHIGSCCYNVSLKRIKAFQKKFAGVSGMIEKRNGKFFLNLLVPMIAQLKKEGVLEQNIEVIDKCTSCFPDDFFSNRRQKEKHGLMMAVISLTF